VLPFSFKLPENIPGSMNVALSSKPGQKKEYAAIKYTAQMWVGGLKDSLWHEFEFDLR
jgi:hypothetical protein